MTAVRLRERKKRFAAWNISREEAVCVPETEFPVQSQAASTEEEKAERDAWVNKPAVASSVRATGCGLS